MIHVYTDSSDYTKEGNVVIAPLSGTVRKVAGGAYELNFTAPMDAEGKWAYLIPEAVVKAPVPREVIKTATTGINVDIYKTTAATAMRSGTSEPTTITYTSWSSTADYAVGTRVSWNGSNYRCKYYDETSAYAHVEPPNNPGWWAKIARTTEGSPVLVNLKSGKELIYISGPSSGWYKMETKDGIQGYVKSSDVTFYEHRSASQNQPREITTQLFRIKEVTYMETDRQVSVYATHVSYDLNGIMVAGVKIVRKNPATTLAKIEDGFMTSYAGDIYTDWGTSNAKKYTGEINGKSGMFALLDPDKGVVSAFDAEFRRDNWDLFVLKKTTHNNGFELRVGKNIKGITWKRSTNNGFYLRIVPVAKNKDGENLFLSPTHWLNSSQISSYPVPYMEWLKVEGQVGRDDGNDDGTDWTNTTLREEMERQANERFDADQVDAEQHEITVDFQMMGATLEYSFLRDIQTLDIYDTVFVSSDITGLTATVTVQEIEFDILKGTVIGAKLSNVRNYRQRRVSGCNLQNNCITWSKMTSDAVDGINEEVKNWVEDNFKRK